MNWSRGLLRAWIGFTVLWLVGCGFVMYAGWPEVPHDYASELLGKKKESDWVIGTPGKPNYFDKFDPNPVRDHVQMFAIYAFSWPALFFVLGWGMLWIGRGFRKS
jgi:hypothetical protein